MAQSIKSYLKYNIFCLKLVGLWTDQDDIFATKYYWIYTVVANVLFLGTFNLSQLIYLALSSGSLDEMAASGCLALVFIMPNIKSFFYLKNWRLVKDLVARLDKEEFQPKTPGQKNNVHLLLRLVQLMHLTYVIMCTIVFPVWLSLPIIKKDRSLPFLAWYPWDPQQPVFYEISHIHQSVGLLYMGLINMNLDVLIFGFAGYIASECDILSDTLENIIEYTSTELRELGKAEFSVKVLREFEEALLSCIRHHSEILRFARDTNRLVNFILFIQFASSVMGICLTMFQITVVSPSSTEFFLVFSYQICIFVELLVYCSFGHETISRSNKIPNALYGCPWMDCSRSFKKNLRFFLQRSQMPIEMKSVNFFVLSLPTCTSVLRISYSFFAMLHQTHKK